MNPNKRFILGATFAASLLILPLELTAQQSSISNRRVLTSGDSSSTADEAYGNIGLTLKILQDGKPKDVIEFQLVKTRADFSVEHVRMIDDEPAILQFSGQMTPLDEQTYRIVYQLTQTLPYKSVNAVQYRDSGWKATIEIKIGTKEVLMRNGETTYVLELSDAIKEKE